MINFRKCHLIKIFVETFVTDSNDSTVDSAVAVIENTQLQSDSKNMWPYNDTQHNIIQPSDALQSDTLCINIICYGEFRYIVILSVVMLCVIILSMMY